MIPVSAQVTHVVQISLDGLGAKYLEFYLEDAPDQFPSFVRLTTEGAFTFNARCDYDVSETVPNHATMFTARPVLQPAGYPDTTHHGFNNNFPGPNDTLHASGNPNVPYKASFFDVAHDHGLITAFYASKTRLAVCDRSYDAVNGMLDLVGEDNGKDKIDLGSVVDLSGAAIATEVDALLQDLNGAMPAHYSFMHLSEPDLTGHANNWGSPAWSNMVRAVDVQLGRVLDAIQGNPVLSNHTALIITADHGGGGVRANAHTEAYHITNYTIPFFLWGPGVPPGVDLYSLMPNRGDPGTNRVDYTEMPQPIRDGDAGNLGLSLLGLPPIPDSFMIPDLLLSPVLLAYGRGDGTLKLSWSADLAAFVLEHTDGLHVNQWQPITNDIETADGQFSHTVTVEDNGSPAYYRLRRRGIRIRTQPQSQVVYPGDPVVLAVGADGSGILQYQWQHDGVDLPGATQASYNLLSVTADDQGDYQALLTDGLDTVTSDVATVTVLLQPTILEQPQSQVVPRGSDVVLSVTATGSGDLSYQWSLNGTNLDGATKSSLDLPNVQAEQSGDYVVLVTDAHGSTASQPATLTVLVPISILQLPQNQIAHVGEDVSFTVVIEGYPPPYGYRWRKGSTRVDHQVLNGTTSTFTLTNVQLSQAGNYNVVLTNSSTATPVISAPFSLTVLE